MLRRHFNCQFDRSAIMRYRTKPTTTIRSFNSKCVFVVLTVFIVCIAPSLCWNTFKNETVKKLKILAAFAHPGKSHFEFFKPLLEELSNRGHEVTVVSYFPRERNGNKTLPNYRDIDLRSDQNDVFVNVVDLNKIDTWSPLRFVKELIKLREWAFMSCEAALANEDVQKLLHSEQKFDLILTEAFNSDCFLCFADHFKVPFIVLSSHDIMPWIIHRFNNPIELSYVPLILQMSQPEMTLVERLLNPLMYISANVIYNYGFQTHMQKIVDGKCGSANRSLNDISKETSALLMNTHYSIHGARPLVPNIVEVGGLHIPPETKPLPEDIRKFLDAADEGVLYFNMGSMVKSSTMPEKLLRDVVKVIGSLRQKVLWKWEADNLPDAPGNVMLRKWLPQFDILNHPNVKCFLGHGGLLGLSEGIYTGIPMVLIPFYGDQFHNAAAAVSRGVAKIVKYSEINERDLRNALNAVCNDPGYRENARKLSKAYRDRAESPLETAVWWTEFVGRNRDYNYLQSYAAKLTWYQYYSLDVILCILAVSLLSACVTYHAIRFVRDSLAHKDSRSAGKRFQDIGKKRN